MIKFLLLLLFIIIIIITIIIILLLKQKHKKSNKIEYEIQNTCHLLITINFEKFFLSLSALYLFTFY